MCKLSVVVVLLAARLASCVPAVHLSDEEYNKLPKLITLEHYAECLVPQDAAYCLATFHLTSPAPSPLYDTMKKISEYEPFNYNHTLLHRGVCVTRSCRRFLNSSSRELDTLVPALEACVNDSVHKEYSLEASVLDLKYCKRTGETLPLGYSEWAVALVVAALLLLNLAGTVYDVLLKEPNEPGCLPVTILLLYCCIAWLMAFSVRLSWKQLTIIREDHEGDPRLNNLKPIQGVRTLNMFLVVMSHVVVIIIYGMPTDNPRFLELMPYSIFSAILFNGHFIMQSNMLLASFLVSYNFLIFRESKKRFSWRYLTQAIVQRFFRLTPAYMLVVSLVATWTSRFTSGPASYLIEEERATCRDKWWLHFFYLHNIFKANDICLTQSWYLGADFQLFIFGMAMMMVLWRYPALTRPLLAIGLLVATAIQFYLIYFLNLRPVILMHSPERLRNLFHDEPTFWLLHSSFQGNLQGYIFGLIVGITYYKWEQEGFRVYEKKWFRVMHVLGFPLGLAWILAGHPFLLADHVDQLYLALYAMVDRLTFAVIISFLLLGFFYKINTPYLGVVGWRGWQAMGRLSYSVLLLHTITYSHAACAKQYPREIGLYIVIYDVFGTLVVTYIAAVPLTLLVEYPLQRLQKVLFSPAPDKTETKEDNRQRATSAKEVTYGKQVTNGKEVTNGKQVTNGKKIL